MHRVRWIVVSFTLLLLPHAAAQEQKPAPQEPLPAIPVYAPSAGGLKKLIKDILAATKANQNQAISAYVSALVLPDAQA